MSTAWGIPDLRDADGTIIDATTPQDMQLIIDAQYQNAGILTGATVGLRGDMKVDIYDGAVVMKWNNRGSVLVPVYRQTITLDPAPATGQATVSFYVEQADTATSKAASVVMTTGAVPTGRVVLDKIIVPAGTTKTSSCTRAWDREYAMHSQSTLGALSVAVDQGGDVRTKGKTYKKCSQRFTVDTDRTLNLKMSVTAGRTNASGVSSIGTIAASMGSLRYGLYVDDVLVKTYEVGIDKRWQTIMLETMHKVSRGAHTAHLVSQWESDGDMTGNTNWVVRWGGADKYTGDTLTVFDAGVAK
ncbi:hypothetical protein [Kocuria sp.]|uniref:hypothetical protein n=1 Tax=Kocuria sp. TaxID=1871328 RepID=UPI0026DC2063|nr:hypothetical protein [Kocuria sp.]MDO4919951.1 hypothetical protein [Kocuria sp.]